MKELLLVGFSFGGCGAVIGWLFGHTAGFVDGIEHQKRMDVHEKRVNAASRI